MKIREELFKEQDLNYKSFHKKLVPDLDEDKIIGVRVPVLRKIAKQAEKEGAVIQNPYYYEEFMIKGLMIGYSKSEMSEKIKRLEEFVGLIDNWAVCDGCCSNLKFTEKNREIMLDFISHYINKSQFETRFAVVMLMSYYLCDEYIDKALELMLTVNFGEYYSDMAVAWALASAMVNYPEKVLAIIEGNKLPVWVHNKTIQKCRESYRITNELKSYLNTLKRKAVL